MRELCSIVFYSLVIGLILYVLVDNQQRKSLERIRQPNCMPIEERLVQCQMRLREAHETNIKDGFRRFDLE